MYTKMPRYIFNQNPILKHFCNGCRKMQEQIYPQSVDCMFRHANDEHQCEKIINYANTNLDNLNLTPKNTNIDQ